MPEAADWKQKYRDSLVEMEGEEKRWRKTELALRGLVSRLCAAGMGIDPKLDDQLVALAAANRRNADAAELEKLTKSLTAAVVAVDAVSPVTTVILTPVAKRWESACIAAARVLRCMRSLDLGGAAEPELLARLSKVDSDAGLAAVLDKTADLIRGHCDALALERLQAAAVMADVTGRLGEVSGYLDALGDEAQSRFSDAASVNDNVISQVRELTAEVGSATELRILRDQVSARLATLTQQVLDFRTREAQRLAEHTGRAAHMLARIAHLERETRELHSKLDQEKYGARHDPLTLVANRKSFDERFADVIEQHSQNEVPVAVLLWDVDNFKSINDTYGHRAGDRVLKTIATCLVSGLRPEDFIARIGGEEFVVLLTGLEFLKAQQIADGLRLGVQSLRFHFRGRPVRVTASCGLTAVRKTDTANTVFERADAALYQAKQDGKNICVAA